MTIYVYIDESIENDGVFVMAGYIADEKNWEDFSKEWEEMLPYGMKNQDGNYYFKMSHMAVNEERMERVPAFLKIIEKYVLGFVSVKIDISELKNAISRITVPKADIDWGIHSNSYYIAFRCLLDMFHLHRSEIVEAIPLDEKINFIFDNRAEKKAILSGWDFYMENRPDNVKQLYGDPPRFEDDEEFLPLQAADFWAWWVRKWYKEGTPEKIKECNFGLFELRKKRKYLRVEITFNEDQLVTVLKRIVGRETDRPVYDTKNNQ